MKSKFILIALQLFLLGITQHHCVARESPSSARTRFAIQPVAGFSFPLDSGDSESGTLYGVEFRYFPPFEFLSVGVAWTNSAFRGDSDIFSEDLHTTRLTLDLNAYLLKHSKVRPYIVTGMGLYRTGATELEFESLKEKNRTGVCVGLGIEITAHRWPTIIVEPYRLHYHATDDDNVEKKFLNYFDFLSIGVNFFLN